MKHTPYGYYIKNGMAVIDEECAAKVRKFFEAYLSGLALTPAAEAAGLKLYHGSAGRMLRNKHYLGDEYYPAIIDQELFDKAEEERKSRASQLGRVRELKVKETPAIPLHFTMGKQIQEFDNPFRQAEYAYSLIESEVEMDEGN